MNFFCKILVNCEINNNDHYHNQIYCKIDHTRHEMSCEHDKMSMGENNVSKQHVILPLPGPIKPISPLYEFIIFLHYLFYPYILQVNIDKLMLI